jgi:2,4-dienoyl-CoA reductase-like NADH-dependent reductase (Old Yellow Enzyme family)
VTADGQGWKGELGIFNDTHLPGLTRLATTLREAGATNLVQIFHGGARADGKLTGGMPLSSSSEGEPPTAREATADDIERILTAFRDAAIRAHRAGFEGVELHGAHGYLLGQFLSATGNRRTDEWGGSLENRARFMREAVRRTRAAVPASFVVGIRISPEDFGQTKGVDLDENLTVAKWLCDDGIDFLHISMWDSFANTKKRPEEHALPLFRAACAADVPIVVAGSIWTREQAEGALAKGADGVALGRSAIANPDWPKRIADASWVPRKPPMSPEELRERGLSDAFVNYMRRFRFVADAPTA